MSLFDKSPIQRMIKGGRSNRNRDRYARNEALIQAILGKPKKPIK